MTTPTQTLHAALKHHGLASYALALSNRMLTQNGREVGEMDAQTGWCLIRLIDGKSTDDVPRYVVKAARALFAGLNRPLTQRSEP